MNRQISSFDMNGLFNLRYSSRLTVRIPVSGVSILSTTDRECGRNEVRALELIIITRCIVCFLPACNITISDVSLWQAS